MTPELPTRRDGDGIHIDYIETHPAYGSITLSQVYGKQHLAGSDFEHPVAFRIEISRAERNRSLARDWWFSTDTLVTLELSPAQFTHFVASVGKGEGTPCTLNFIGGVGSVPGIELATHQTDDFSAEMRKDLESAIKSMQAAVKGLESANNSSARKDAVQHVKAALRAITDSAPFVAKQFNEHIEAATETAKAEAHAILNATIQSAGLAALQNRARESDMKLIEDQS